MSQKASQARNNNAGVPRNPRSQECDLTFKIEIEMTASYLLPLTALYSRRLEIHCDVISYYIDLKVENSLWLA